MTLMSNVLTVNGVFYSVKDKIILKDININLKKEESIALIGNNGSGKSTLLDIIAGDIRPEKGFVSYWGNSQYQKDRIGILFDNLPLIPLFKVRELIHYYASIYNIKYDYLRKQYFDIFNIDKINNSFVNSLSLGEKKRVSLLISIMHEPDLLIWDEPFSNLDPIIINRIWDAVNRENRSILFTSHNWDDAVTRATKVCLINEGVIIQPEVSVEEILKELPSSKKIIVKSDPDVLTILNDCEYYDNEGDYHIFLDTNSRMIESLNKLTTNYSILNVSIKDAYLYKIKHLHND